MFEKLNMTKRLKRQISKAVSIALSAAMLITGLPADLSGGAGVKAAESTEVAAAGKAEYTQDNAIRETKAAPGGEDSDGSIGTGDSDQDDLYTYTNTYDFRNGSIVPTDTTNGTATVKSDDGKLTLACGPSNGYGYNGNQHGSILKAGNTITIHVLGKAKIFIGGCNFSKGTLTITSGETELKRFDTTKTDACYHNNATAGLSYDYQGEETDLVLEFSGGETYIPIITVERTEPKPSKTEVKATVTVNDASHLLQAGDTIELVNTANEQDKHDITSYTSDGEDIALKVNSTYDIVSSNEDIEATAGGKKTVTTTTEDLTVTVDLISTVVNPTVTVSETAAVPAGEEYTLTLVNEADDTDTVTLANGGKVKLKIDKTYKLNCSSKKVAAAINGSILLTVDANLTAIVVSVDGPDTTHHTYDVWDFGAEALQNTDLITYNNLLTADIINGWFSKIDPKYTPGSVIPDKTLEPSGANVDAGNGLTLVSNGNKGKWRLRGLKTVTDISSEQNEASLIDEFDNSYRAIMYDNAGNGAMWMTLEVKAGDKVSAVVSSNGADSTITWESLGGEDKQTYVFTRKSRTKLANTCTFTASEDGVYKLYTPDEKLVVARIYRERPNSVTVSGTITLPSGAVWSTDAKLVFTNRTTGQRTEATVTNTNGALSYTVSLFEQYGYDVSLEGLEGVIVGAKNKLDLPNEAGNTTFNVECIAVELVAVTGSLADLTPAAAAKLKLTFKNDEKIYVPKITINAEQVTYTGKFEKDVEYTIKESGVDDYTLDTTTIKVSAAGTKDIKFTKKPVHAINVKLEGPTTEDAAKVALAFSRLDENFEPDGYEYSFTGTQNIELRDGQYKVKAELEGYTQKVTSDVKVKGAAVEKTIVMVPATPAQSVAYKETITVGATGDYQTINDALDAVRRMTRTEGQRVTISIAPGDYEEMLVVDVPNVTLKNASTTPSIALKNKGVDIDENAVRITSYYGHGYTYYSMGNDCKWDADLLAVNKENGYPSFVNPGSGTKNGSFWNATVVIDANGFQAEGIIFENSFNQYMSKKAAEDVIVNQGGAKELADKPRAEMEAGDTTVQDKSYVERAAALAIKNGIVESSFDNCKFVGRQDTLYGGRDTTAAFYKCSIYGGTDFIMGPMTAVFAKCDLVLNTMEDKNDVAYITAPQQTSGRGYLMYNCEVKSTEPGVDTASAKVSKPAYLGTPWDSNGEAVFFHTIVGTASDGTSFILPKGWSNRLSTPTNSRLYEYRTYELTKDADGKVIDNSASREYGILLTNPLLDGKTNISVEAFLGDWKPFAGKDMKIVLPDGTTIDEPVAGEKPGDGDDDGTGDGDDGTGDGNDSSFDGWDRVARPVINRVDYSTNDGQDKVTVTVTANVGDDGGQELVVDWKKDGAAASQTKTSTTKQKTHRFEFTCEGPGKYVVTATLKRKGRTDKVTKNYVTIKANGKVEFTPEREGVHVELLEKGEYTYTGSAIKPAIAVYNGDELLTEGVDYTVKYTNNVKAGNKNDGKKAPTITITGKGRLTGKTTQTFTIQKKDLTDDDVVIGGMLDGRLVVAENAAVSPILAYNGVVLKAGAKKDFELTTGLNKNKPAKSDAGKEITIKGVNNYTGELKLTLDVRSKSELQKITAVQVNKTKKYEYNGEKHTVELTAVKAKTTSLTALDYVIVYNGDQKSAGTQKFTVIGMGLYTGSKTASFKINPRKAALTHEVDDSLKAGSTVTLSYKSAGVTFNDAITVTDAGLDNATLVLGKDYKVSYSANKKVGTGKYTITFLGNYKGSAAIKNQTFTITKVNLADLSRTDYPDERYGELYIKSADKAYGKKAAIIKSAPYVLVDGVALKTSDYTVKYYLDEAMTTEMKGKDKVELGANAAKTITVQITGKGNYEGTVTTTYDVSNADKTDISKVKVTPQTTDGKKQNSVPYSGSAVYPAKIVITQGKTTLATLTPDANGDWNTNPDYEVTFVNNIEKGKATIIVTGTGSNRGSKTATYSVGSRSLAKDVAAANFWEDFKDLKSFIPKSVWLLGQ